jgi:hypothetical protein
LSLRLLTTIRSGGGKSCFERAGGGSSVVFGRSGNVGGGGSNSGLPGGVLNGEDLSCEL